MREVEIREAKLFSWSQSAREWSCDWPVCLVLESGHLSLCFPPSFKEIGPDLASVLVQEGQVCPVSRRGELHSPPSSQYPTLLIVGHTVVDILMVLPGDP